MSSAAPLTKRMYIQSASTAGGESEAEYNARRKIQKFHRHEYEKITVTRIEKIK